VRRALCPLARRDLGEPAQLRVQHAGDARRALLGLGVERLLIAGEVAQQPGLPAEVGEAGAILGHGDQRDPVGMGDERGGEILDFRASLVVAALRPEHDLVSGVREATDHRLVVPEIVDVEDEKEDSHLAC